MDGKAFLTPGDTLIVIHVKLFAIVRERAGISEMSLTLPDPCTVSDARDAIVANSPNLGDLLRISAFAVNQAYASLETKLHDQDEVAIIPPVSGG